MVLLFHNSQPHTSSRRSMLTSTCITSPFHTLDTRYRARLHVMTRAMKACKREIKSALNLASQSATALFLKSNYEFTRRNYRKAIKLLNSCPKGEPHINGQSLAVMYYNNLAAIHFQVWSPTYLHTILALSAHAYDVQLHPHTHTHCTHTHTHTHTHMYACAHVHVYSLERECTQMGKHSLASMYYSKAIQANEAEAGRAPPSETETCFALVWPLCNCLRFRTNS